MNYAIDLLNQICLFGSPMKVGYMTAGSSKPSALTPSPTTTRPPPLLHNSPQNFLSFSDSPITDARQVLAHNSSRRDSTGSNSGGHHSTPSPREGSHSRSSHNAPPLLPPPPRSSNYYPQWLRHDTIQQIHDWKEKERSRQGSSSSGYHRRHSNQYNGHTPKSYR